MNDQFEEQTTLIGNDKGDSNLPYGAVEAHVITDEYTRKRDKSSISIWEDIQETIQLSIPIFFSMISWVGVSSLLFLRFQCPVIILLKKRRYFFSGRDMNYMS